LCLVYTSAKCSGLWYLTPLSTILGNWSTRRKPLTCHMSLTNSNIDHSDIYK
jgi:hypothetical protein